MFSGSQKVIAKQDQWLEVWENPELKTQDGRGSRGQVEACPKTSGPWGALQGLPRALALSQECGQSSLRAPWLALSCLILGSGHLANWPF